MAATTIAGERTSRSTTRAAPTTCRPDNEMVDDFDPTLVEAGPRTDGGSSPLVADEEMAGVR